MVRDSNSHNIKSGKLPIKLLYVEDDEDDYIILRDLLDDIDEENYELEWAENYQDACNKIENNYYDIYILDYYIGERTGLELVSQYFSGYSIAPVILLTGQDQRDIDIRAMEHGIADYIDKNYLNPALLERSVRYTYRHYEILKELKESHSFIQSTLDSLTSQIAVINESGEIIAVNEAWRRFARENSLKMDRYGIGSNYLDVCSKASSANHESKEIYKGLKEVIAGKRTQLKIEYPCHSPSEKRWFVLRANRFSNDEPIRVIIAHENVTDRKLMEIEKNRLVNDLGERVKELTILHEVSSLLQDEKRTINSILQDIVNRLPRGWSYPEATAARILYRGKEYRTDNYISTQWKQVAEFNDSSYNNGSVEIVLLEEREHKFEGPFLKEERELLNSLSDMIKRFLDNKISRHTLQENLDHISKLHRYEEIIREITQSVHSSLNLQDVLDNAVKMLRENVKNVDNVSIYTIQDDEVILKAYSGYPKWYIESVKQIPYPVGATWKTINENRSVYVEDTDNDEHIGEAGKKAGTKSYFSIPVHSDHESKSVLGCLHLHSLQKHAFGQDEINLLETVTRQIEVAFNNARQAEAIRKSEKQFKLISENVADMILLVDLKGKILYASPSCNSLFSDHTSMVGVNAFEYVHPDDRESLRAILNKMENTGIGHQEKAEFRIISKDGAIHHIETMGNVIGDENENVSQIVIVARDVTEKKMLEEQQLRAQRMESIGTLAGGIAHDLNNVLQPIMLTAELIKSKSLDESNKHLFETLQSSTQRAANLVNQVLSFSRGIEGEKVIVQLRHIIKEIHGMLKETFPRSIDIGIDVPKDLYTVRGDSTRLHQVIMNLCVNARDAMPEGGTLKISAQNFYIDENYSRMNIEAKKGQYVVITVADNGVGIAKEHLDKIFEPFFTTKQLNKGTGLGLSTAFGIVKNHGGFIKVYSEKGRGSEFRIYLPSNESGKSSETREEFRESEAPKGNGELILVVDDEESVRNITRLTLESNGYSVIIATDGAEAITSFNRFKDDIDIVIMDMMMPVLSGDSSINVLRKLEPSIKIIASTGLEDQLRKLSDDPNLKPEAVLPKPYTSEKLLKTVKSVVELKQN